MWSIIKRCNRCCCLYYDDNNNGPLFLLLSNTIRPLTVDYRFRLSRRGGQLAYLYRSSGAVRTMIARKQRSTQLDKICMKNGTLRRVGLFPREPVVYNGQVFFGSWDGNEYATDLKGNKHWSQYLGQTNVKGCEDGNTGVSSTATIANVSINGHNKEVDFVGGGNATFYALNAKNGKILWNTRLGPSPATFIWASPAYYKGSVYIGVVSTGIAHWYRDSWCS